jgi:hypothetical protein
MVAVMIDGLGAVVAVGGDERRGGGLGSAFVPVGVIR